MPDDHPGDDYPAECRALMDRVMERVAEGDITGALRLQTKANACLERHGITAVDMPAEYFQLMHQGIQAARRGDMDEVERTNGRMEQVLALMDIPGREGLPDECKALLRASNEAEDRGDLRENIRLTRLYNACLQEHGLTDIAMPDEFFELQLTALEAQERGDMPAYQRALAECQLLLQAHGYADTGQRGPSA